MWCKDKGQIAVVLLLFIFCDAFAQPRFKGRKQIAKHQKPAVMHYVEPRAGAPQTVTAQCTDSEVIVTISPDLLGIQKPVQPSDLSMGGCGVTSPAGAQPFVIEAPLQGCGSTVEMLGALIVYTFSLDYNPSPIDGLPIVRTNPAVVQIECQYNRCFLDSQLTGSNSQFVSPRVAQSVMQFQLDAFRFYGLTTSSNIQNEIIQTLADMVLGEVRKKYESANSAGLCLKSDGTRERCNVENVSVIIRFVRNSMPVEHLIGLLDLQQLDAEYITSEILFHLCDAGYSADSILSQCYDGASVMSGVRGGVQALLQKRLDRYVPYIHCYNHQLHLVLEQDMQSEPCEKRFFSLSSSVYNFVHHHYVLNKHDAPCLKKLLEIRWTSHCEVTRCTVDNQEEILSILSEMTEDGDDTVDLCTEASGLLCQIKRHHLSEIGKFPVRVLGVLKPANAILQSQSVDLCSASEV
ncbi:ZP3 protein, partial [Polypterus senegalus]